MDIWVTSGIHTYIYCYYEKSYTGLGTQKQAFLQGLCLGVELLGLYALSAVCKMRSFQMFSFLLTDGYKWYFMWWFFICNYLIISKVDNFHTLRPFQVPLWCISLSFVHFSIEFWEELIIYCEYFLCQEHILQIYFHFLGVFYFTAVFYEQNFLTLLSNVTIFPL